MIHRILGLFVLLIVLPSCLTVRQIERNCDKFAKICLETTRTDTVIIHDSTTITRRDTIVEYELVKETDYDTIYIEIKDDLVSSDTSKLYTGLAQSVAFISESKLYHYLESGDTILNIRLNDALTEIIRLERIIKSSNTVNTVTIKEDTNFGKFCKKWFWGSLVVLVISGIILLGRLKLF